MKSDKNRKDAKTIKSWNIKCENCKKKIVTGFFRGIPLCTSCYKLFKKNGVQKKQ